MRSMRGEHDEHSKDQELKRGAYGTRGADSILPRSDRNRICGLQEEKGDEERWEGDQKVGVH
jgi:hypothetical protein